MVRLLCRSLNRLILDTCKWRAKGRDKYPESRKTLSCNVLRCSELFGPEASSAGPAIVAAAAHAVCSVPVNLASWDLD